MFLQPEGIDGQGGATAGGGAAQDTLAVGIVDVLGLYAARQRTACYLRSGVLQGRLLVGEGDVPFDEMVQQVVGQCGNPDDTAGCYCYSRDTGTACCHR